MWNIISFESTDGLLLHGNLNSNSNFKSIVVHVHGMAGNFYSSKYHPLLAEKYSQIGYDYLVINNRGSEYIKQLKNNRTGNSSYYGFSYELFEESDRDIVGVINFLTQKGYRNIILQGHSSGCQKIMYTLFQNSDIKVDKVILFSPCDDVGLAINKYSEDEMNKKIAFANSYQEKILLPPEFFFDMPLSKETFLSHYGNKSCFNIFHYHNNKLPFAEIAANKRPTLVVFGGKDYILDFGVTRKIFLNFPNYSLQIVEGADHKYKGQEEALASLVYDFLK